MQRAYISKLMELASTDKRVFHILADSAGGLDEMFRYNFPDRIYNFGIAEQNTIGIAAGLALGGKLPFVFAQGAFLTYRAMEFIRDDLCFQNLNVKLVGQGSGLSLSNLGVTHHTTEDVAVLRSLPNLTILSPATPLQTAACTEFMYTNEGPMYMRIGMNGEKEYFNQTTAICPDKPNVFGNGTDIALLTTGSILEEVIEAAKQLEEGGISTKVINFPILKPFPQISCMEEVQNCLGIAIIEEHQIIGGLGSIVAEAMVKYEVQKKQLNIGLDNKFAIGYGTQQELRQRNGLDAMNIAKAIGKELLK